MRLNSRILFNYIALCVVHNPKTDMTKYYLLSAPTKRALNDLYSKINTSIDCSRIQFIYRYKMSIKHPAPTSLSDILFKKITTFYNKIKIFELDALQKHIFKKNIEIIYKVISQRKPNVLYFFKIYKNRPMIPSLFLPY